MDAIREAELNAERVGTETEAVIEGYDSAAGMWYARTAADAPDIDGRLWLAGAETQYQAGQYVNVLLTSTVDDYDLLGEVKDR